MAFFVFLIVLLLHTVQSGEVQPSPGKGQLCTSVHVKSWADFDLLRNCSSVVGHVELVNLQLTSAQAAKISSNVVEITDYLLVHRVHGLESLQLIFPQLVLIRGQEQLFDRYSLVVYENRNLRNLGLKSLLRIQRGYIRVESNPLLCFVDTVNWVYLLGNKTQQNFALKNNKAPNHCLVCLENIRNNASVNQKTGLYNHCWDLNTSQQPLYGGDLSRCEAICRQPMRATDCGSHVDCCRNCLSDCSTTRCELCANLKEDGKCVDTCSAAYYQWNKRECLTESNCRKKGLIPHAGYCLEKCPQYHEEVKDHSGQRNCSLVCTGTYIVKTVKDLIGLKDCTTINGSLSIELTEVRAKIIDELERLLVNVKEITGYLKVKGCTQLVSLHFLQNLHTIGGEELIGNRYAFYVVDNYYLEQIWTPNQKVAILKGYVYFHLNPRLCYEKILALGTSLRSSPIISEMDASPNSNGERVVCGNAVRLLNATVEDYNSTAVRIKVDAMSSDDKQLLLGYVHFYKEAPIKNVTMYDGRHGCGHDNWRMDISPNHNVRHVISKLKPYTQYAYFVRTMTMTDYHTHIDAYSTIQYFRTLPSKPGPVSQIFYHSLSASELIVHWWPPRFPNGVIKNYILYHDRVPTPNETLFNTGTKSSSDTCICPMVQPEKSGPSPEDENYYSKEQITYDEALPNLIYIPRQESNEENDTQTTTTSEAPTLVHETASNKSDLAKSRAALDDAVNQIHKDEKILTEAERKFAKYREDLESKALAEQDTGSADFPIVHHQPICAAINASVTFQIENDCKRKENFVGTEIPGHVHSYILSNLEPAVTYRITVRACVEDLPNGCGNEKVILAETLSKSVEKFLADMKKV